MPQYFNRGPVFHKPANTSTTFTPPTYYSRGPVYPNNWQQQQPIYSNQPPVQQQQVQYQQVQQQQVQQPHKASNKGLFTSHQAKKVWILFTMIVNRLFLN